MNVNFELAKQEDARALTMVQKHAFHEDSKFFLGEKTLCGPPGYSSLKWNIGMIRSGKYYKIRLDDYRIIGGFIVSKKSNDVYYLTRIFIEPEFQNKGVGSKAIKFIENTYASAKKWTLDTPGWNTRNHKFYLKNGYVQTGEKNELFLFEKSMNKDDQHLKLFARIDYRNAGVESSSEAFNEHIAYLTDVAEERYFRGGGFADKDGGMILFKAKDINEAKRIADNDPLISKGIYSYELYEWDLKIISKKEH